MHAKWVICVRAARIQNNYWISETMQAMWTLHRQCCAVSIVAYLGTPFFIRLPRNHLHELANNAFGVHEPPLIICFWQSQLWNWANSQQSLDRNHLSFFPASGQMHTQRERKKACFFFSFIDFRNCSMQLFFSLSLSNFITIKWCSIVITIAICRTQRVAINLNVLKLCYGYFLLLLWKRCLSHDNGCSTPPTNAHFADSFISAIKYRMPDYGLVQPVKGVSLFGIVAFFFLLCAKRKSQL